MSKNETTVKTLGSFFSQSAIIFLITICIPTFGENPNTSSGRTSPAECLKVAKELFKGNQKKIQDYTMNCIGTDVSSCKQQQKDWNEQKGKLGDACGKAGMGSDSTPGSIACSKEINSCSGVNKVQSNLDEDSTEKYDTDRISEQQDKCPAIAATDLDKIKEDEKTLKEEIKELEEDIPDLEQKQVEAQNSGQDKVIEVQEAMQTAQQECSSRMKEISRGLKDKEKEIFDQTQQMYAQVTELTNQIGQAENAKRQAGLEFNNAKTEMDLNCHKYAIEKVNQHRASILEQVANSNYHIGGFNAAVSRAGTPSRKADQALAKEYFKNCSGDAATKIVIKRAEEKYKMDIISIDGQITNLKAQQAQVQNQIGIMNNNERARANQEAQEDLQETAGNCQQQAMLNQQKLGQAQMSAQSGGQAIAAQIASKKQSLALAKGSYENVQRAYRLKNSVSRGSGGENFWAAMSAYNILKGTAEGALSCCGETGMDGLCKEARSFLNSIGQTSMPTDVSPASDVSVDVTKASTTVTTPDGKEVASVNTDPKKIKEAAQKASATKPTPLPAAKPRCIRGSCKDFKPAPPPTVKGKGSK